MNMLFFVLTVLFIVVSSAMVLIILVQRAQGGGLAGAFGGAGGAGTDTLFGGRVGDALTWATVIAFVLYLLFAIALNRVEAGPTATDTAPILEPASGGGDDAAGGVPAGEAGEAGVTPDDEGSAPGGDAGSAEAETPTGTPEAADPADPTESDN